MIKHYQKLDLFGKKTFEKAVIKPPFRILAEMPNEACFYYVLRGNSVTYTPSQLIRSAANEGVVLQCGTYFNEYLLQGSDTTDCEAVAVHFYPEVLKALYGPELPGLLQELESVKPLQHLQLQASSSLKNYVDSLLFYFDHPELVSEAILKLKLKELILLLAKTTDGALVKSLLASLFTPEEIDFKTVIETHVYHNINVEELAQLTHLSLSSFKREFAKHYDCPPARYLKRRKLEKAANLLQGTDLRVSEIALDCGFLDLGHFSKSFQNFYGHPPSEFRKQARE